ncbi:MAG: CHAD domain-containing protein, partial [Proteobacteria bacterium]|nr:CHAD domain-containing protein [Pseudomonadota bacterium]
MYKHLSFNLPDGYDQQQLINELAAYYSIKKERSGPKNIAFYDTFDWRLFNKSLVLYESGKKLFLRELFNSAIICGAEMTSRPVFIWDFPDSELKKMLAPIIKMRALFKLAEIYSRSTPYRILNPDEKTVARLVYEEIRPSPETDAPVLNAQLWLQSVRGYPRYSQDLAKRFEDAGLEPNKKEDIYFKALEAAHKNPGSYSSKLNIQLSEKMRSDQAAKIILRFLLQVIKINQDNIEKALDTEFLHDFRVAIRRTRSALAQIKYVFPQDTTDRFKKDFAFAGKFSNQLRDLDVYLLKEDTYKAMLPDVLRDDIDPLFDYLRKKRSKALQETIKGLKSKTYVQILHDWEGFLNEPPQDSPTASNAGLPIIDLARKRTYKKYRNVVKTGNRIIENTDDKKLHALRIECKQLRYLM